MGYIYKIINDVTDKVYIGKTTQTVEKRFKEHKRRSIYNDKYHLYRAMRKYGVEHFFIEEIEECPSEVLSDRERYWIDYYDSYNNGYNMTVGGDGNLLYNYKEVANKYLELKSEKETMAYFGCSFAVVQKACKEYNIKIQRGNTKEFWESEIGQEKKRKLSILMKNRPKKPVSEETRKKISKNKREWYKNNLPPSLGKKATLETRKKQIQNSGMAKKVICLETKKVYSSALQASKDVGLKSSSGISQCCAKRGKTARKLHWAFYDEDSIERGDCYQ